MASKRILIVQGEEDIREILEYTLERAGHRVESVSTGLEARRALTRDRPELVLVDLTLPDEGGLVLCRAIRGEVWSSDVGVILLSAPDDEELVVEGLQLGVDDYVAKPFGNKELVSRVESVLKRRTALSDRTAEHEVIVRGRLKVDVGRQRIWYDSRELPSSADEFEILHRLASRPGQIFSRQQLESEPGTQKSSSGRRSVESRMRGVRKILGEGKDLIETERRIGYRFVEEERM